LRNWGSGSRNRRGRGKTQDVEDFGEQQLKLTDSGSRKYGGAAAAAALWKNLKNIP